MAALAEHEARRISDAYTGCNGCCKSSWSDLGGYWARQSQATHQERQAVSSAFSARLMPLLNGFASQGLSRRAMVIQLNDLGIKAPRGGAWSLGQVQRVMQNSY